MSAEKPVRSSIPSTNKVIDYWPSWTDWSRNSLKEYLPGGSKSRVDVINICFAIPQADGSLKWNDARTDSDDPTKKYIQELRKAGKKVLIAVGGDSDRGNAIQWNLDKPGIPAKLASSITKFIKEYGLDGVDIDYERPEREPRKSVPIFIEHLRKELPNHIISYAAWSIGAYHGAKKDDEKEEKNDEINKDHIHPEWQYAAYYGIDVDTLKKAGKLLDWVNVMSYDAFDLNIKPRYNPIEAIKAYQALMGNEANKVVLGIELGQHGSPREANIRTSTKEVQPWIEYAAKNQFGGVMFWTLSFDKTEFTKEKTGAFLELTTKIMPKNFTDIKKLKEEKKPKEQQETKKPKEQQEPPKTTDTKEIKDLKQDQELPDLTGISAENQEKIRNISQEQQKILQKLEKDHQEIRKKRNEQLNNVTEGQKNALKEQFKIHDAQLDTHFRNVKKSLQDQLKHVISQYPRS